MLFIGLAMHAVNFIKTNFISSIMVLVSAPTIGFSFFILKNGVYMLLSCLVFALGLGLLLYRNETEKVLDKQNKL
ncbi:hypothetical protein BXU01_07260 [[Flexibacter] sp. ATCC 35103]|nr:hypothetical protein BXU01_07260 [[Flexibacter] sp. ATCC 35103]